MFKRDFSIIVTVIIFLSLFSCKDSGKSESEPNNTFSQATPIELNSEISGYLDSEKDSDNYVFKSDANQITEIELSGIKGVNHAMQLWKVENSKVTRLKIVDDNRKSSPENFANLHTSPGVYIITVMHGARDEKKGNSETPYKLRISSRDYISEEEEPNDNYSEANIISPGVQLTGYYSPGQNLKNEAGEFREEDWFSFTIDETVNLPVLAAVNLKGVTGVDSVLTMYDSRLNELALFDITPVGGEESISELGITESGIYYVKLYSKNYQYNNSEPYFLDFTLKEHEEGSELENNDAIDRANIISGNEIRGRVGTADDIDYFYFKPENNNKNLYRVELITPPVIDSIITVYDEKKNKIMEIDNGGSGVREVIPNLNTAGGVYFSITSRSGFDKNSDYILQINTINVSGKIETEPNNTKNDANIVDNKITGFTTYTGDVDYFLVKSDSRRRLKLTINGVKNGIIKVSTTDPLGYIIRTVEVKGDMVSEIIETFDKKGYIIVESVKAGFDDPYIISIEEAL
jgi:hypothetical protein